MAPWPGYFISFEGLDGAGKSTQVASLAGTLRVTKRDVLTVRPNNTLLGEILHALVLQHQRGPAVEPWAEALLFNAERVQLLHEVILPALQRGAIVIADRYTDSTLAYQGGGRGLPIDQLLELHRATCGDWWPPAISAPGSPALGASSTRGTPHSSPRSTTARSRRPWRCWAARPASATRCSRRCSPDPTPPGQRSRRRWMWRLAARPCSCSMWLGWSGCRRTDQPLLAVSPGSRTTSLP